MCKSRSIISKCLDFDLLGDLLYFLIWQGAIMGAVKIFNRYPRVPYGLGFIILNT